MKNQDSPTTTTLRLAPSLVQSSSVDLDCLGSKSRYFRRKIQETVARDPSLAGPLVRLAFHDAATFENGPRYYYVDRGSMKTSVQTGGPNGSIRYELGRYENRALSRPLKVVEEILDYVNDKNGQTRSRAFLCNPMSLADAIALAGASAVEASGGPDIPIRLGRPDVDTSDDQLLRSPMKRNSKGSEVTTTLPSAGLDSVGLRLYFGRLGLSEPEFVALSGVHGLGRHVSLLNMTKDCLKNLTQTCLENAPVLLPFVTESVDRFDNSYFKGLLRWNSQQISMGEVAFIPTDVALVVDDGLRRYVESFANDEKLFFRTFRRAFQKLVDTTATTIELY
ncbi:peroxidase [Nitzschia inconspicua]|uniref:Peroxidase n=1 Tax=Nitzschia inconspicua TaxID=303405 RepID=A0A9K3L6I5_9STRA|nr:peroxidase [Nitzschia inconspicua]